MFGQSVSATGIGAEIGTAGTGVPETRDAAPSRPHNGKLHRVRDPRIIRASRKANGPWKRAFDVAATILGAIFLLPLFATLVILVKLTDGGAVFYGHQRVGRTGRLFTCWKFRTMVVDSDRALRDHLAANPAAASEWAATQKLQNDPRITAIGRFLRATSLDELPQLLNVLQGEMSLVGPRPVTKSELNERYAKDRKYYLLVRPGLTGLWQVSGRNRLSYAKRIQLDEQYLREWSFSRDMIILLRTIDVVFRRDGAC
jgi:exopolysaccharide production protein ExoY